MFDTARWQRWRAERRAAAPFLASNAGTYWLGPDPQPVPGVPGLWSAADGGAKGERIDAPDGVRDAAGASAVMAGRVLLAEGADLWAGSLRLRLMRRGGDVAVRVFDPAAPAATTLVDLEAFDPDTRWVVPGRFTPAAASEQIGFDHVDGWVAPTHPAGHVAFCLDGVDYRFTVTPADDGYSAVFADSSNGAQTKQFRFLTIPTADADGTVVLDFNFAYLPPCAFSDHYHCPMPPLGNRIATPVLAGETRPRYRDEEG